MVDIAEWHRKHDQRTGGDVSGESQRGGARGIHRRKKSPLDASAILEGEPAPTPVVVERPRLYAAGALSGGESRVARGHARHAADQQQRPHGDSGLAGGDHGNPGQTEIRRENLQRDVAVTARLEGADLGSGMADVQKVVAGLHMPSSIRVEYGGTYQEQQQSFHDLVIVLMLAVLLLFIVLLFEFGTFAAPVAILSSALLSTSGVFIALLITRTTFNISSFMGMIMVIGIVAKNGILLLDADQKMRDAWACPPKRRCCRRDAGDCVRS